MNVYTMRVQAHVLIVYPIVFIYNYVGITC